MSSTGPRVTSSAQRRTQSEGCTGSTCVCGTRSALRLQRRGLGAQALFLLAQLGRELGAEVLGLEHLADLDLGLGARHRVGAALDPLDRLLLRLHLPEPEA